MTEAVKKLYKEALKNKHFNIEAQHSDPEGYEKPNFWSSTELKGVYVSVYYGWLIAKGEFKRENYHN